MRIVDRVAYINHDIDDAIRRPRVRRPPCDEIASSARPARERIDTLVHDLVETSAREGDIAQSDESASAMLSLRAFMFERVYLGPVTRGRARARPRDRPRIFDALADRGEAPEQITEFIAGMTDRFALEYAAAL